MKTADRIASLLLAVACMALIFHFSAQKAEQSSATSGSVIRTIVAFVMPDFPSFSEIEQKEIVAGLQHIVRKAAHFSVYFLLGFLVANALRTYRLRRKFLIPPAVCLVYAITDELHQHFVPGRSCEGRDVLIDTAGGICGTLFFLLVLYIIGKIKGKFHKKAASD